MIQHLAEADIEKYFGAEGNTTRGATAKIWTVKTKWKKDFLIKFKNEGMAVRESLEERCDPDL